MVFCKNAVGESSSCKTKHKSASLLSSRDPLRNPTDNLFWILRQKFNYCLFTEFDFSLLGIWQAELTPSSRAMPVGRSQTRAMIPTGLALLNTPPHTRTHAAGAEITLMPTASCRFASPCMQAGGACSGERAWEYVPLFYVSRAS